MILIDAINKDNIPPETWTAIGVIVTAVLAFITRLIEKKKDKKIAKKAIRSAVQKTEEGKLVNTDLELKEARKDTTGI